MKVSVPVSVVTGAVGAGKTTLIRRALSHASVAPGRRIVVVKMRFAVEIGCEEESADDVALADWIDAFETQEHLCLCCNPREEFVEVLESLAQRTHLLERVVVETTGLADPACLRPLIAMRETFVLESVVCVVDAGTFGSSPTLSVSGTRSIEHEQVAFASLVAVVTKQSGVLFEDGIVHAVAPLVPTRTVTRDEFVMMSAVTRPAPSSWASLYPDYFSEPTPFGRHQDRLMCASLVGVDALTRAQLSKLMEWLSSLSWVRLKADVHILQGERVLLDGVDGVVTQRKGSANHVLPCNKIALVGVAGVLQDSYALKQSLESAHGIVLQPTVLYSAPAPHVDTSMQRWILMAACATILIVPGIHWTTRAWFLFALALYFWLSRQKSVH